MQLTHSLATLGLTETEARVYTALLELGGDYVSNISRQSGVKRTNCYHALETLSEKGFVSITNKENSKYYIAEDPRRLLEEQKKKMKTAEFIMPDLLALRNTDTGFLPKMKYFEGKKAIQELLSKPLDCKVEILTYTNFKQAMDKFGDTLKNYLHEKAKRNIKARLISPYHKDAEDFIYKVFPKDYLTFSVQILFTNPKQFFLKNDVNIFEDKVSMISLDPKENIGVLIESEVYADTFRTIFNLSWLGATSFIAK